MICLLPLACRETAYLQESGTYPRSQGVGYWPDLLRSLEELTRSQVFVALPRQRDSLALKASGKIKRRWTGTTLTPEVTV